MPSFQASGGTGGSPTSAFGGGQGADDGPPRPPSDEAPDPTGQRPHGYYREAYFGTLAPAVKDVEWQGHQNTVTLRILEADEQRQCAHFAYVRSGGHPEADEYLQARVIYHIALALEAVDGKPITDECKTLEHRLQLSAELPETLQEAIIAAYDEARYEPLAFLHEMAENADHFGQPPGGPGSSSEEAASPPGA